MPERNPILNQLIEANTGFVHALALRLAPAPGLAEDIAQQVFLEFIAKAAQWDLTQDIKPLLAGSISSADGAAAVDVLTIQSLWSTTSLISASVCRFARISFTRAGSSLSKANSRGLSEGVSEPSR